jgi:hypothetical protein
VRRHAKASPAGSTQRQASGLGGFVRGAFATGASSRSADGSGARSFATAALALASAVFLSLLIVSSAGAASQRPFKEVFGSAAQPSFEWSLHIATDRSTGDVLIGNFLAGTVSRFHADGTPAPFSALGTNVIDGREENGKPCAEEPASCDKTSQGELALNGAEIAIDESGGVTDGDIYLTQPDGGQMMYIFDPDGSYLGQITKAGNDSFLGSPRGVAVDSTGTVYLVAGGRILKYVPTASPLANSDYVSTLANLGTSTLGAIALGSGPTANLIFGASNGGFTSQAYQISKETGELEYTFADGYGVSQVAVDPGTGNVLVRNNSRQQEVGEFEAQSGSAPVKVGRILTPARAEGFAMNASGEVYVSEGYGVPNVSVFGTPAAVPSVTVEPASNITGASAILLGTVNPSGLEVTECFFEYEGEGTGGTIPCEGSIPTDSSPHAVHATLSGLEPNGREYRFRLVAKNANGREESSFLTLTTAFTTTTEAAAPVGSTTATLNGVVRPEGTPYTQCLFEYGLTSSAHFTNTAPCNPSALGIPADFSPHAVTAAITGLQVGKAYRFRLVAANENGPQKGRELTFETNGPPQVSAIGALNADQESATLEAKINPSGFGTSYRFEWGPTASYGNSIPLDFEPYVGEGVNPVQVSAKLSGLSAGTVYHYRVVARSKAGKTESPDQILETLNSCGLPEGRCLELVSPRDAGPVGIPGKFIGSAELHLQAADQPGLFAYVVETGFPDAPKGAESFYRGTRGSDGWSSTALSAPILAPNESGAGTSNSSKVLGLSENLSCSIEESNQLLTSDPSTRIVREAGGANLYRRDSAGSYTALTLLPPEGVEDESGLGEIDEYELEGFSRDCGKVVFSTHYRYPGVEALPSAGGGGFLYEWEDDTLRSVGFVPGPRGKLPSTPSPVPRKTTPTPSPGMAPESSSALNGRPVQIPRRLGRPASSYGKTEPRPATSRSLKPRRRTPVPRISTRARTARGSSSPPTRD